MTSSATPDFGPRVAARYDELRPLDAGLETLLAEVNDGAELRGRSVLDVGCGTGTLAVALAREYGCTVCGVDASPEMIAVADAKRVPGTRFEVAPAEALPFGDGSFERGLMRSVVHHLDRPRAFPEVRRVLEPGCRLAIHNMDPDGLDELWYVRLFPQLRELERVRIPSGDGLRSELEHAGFESVRVERTALDRAFDRETALGKLRGRHVSSFDLLEEHELEEGIARAEAELPADVRYTLRSLLVVANA